MCVCESVCVRERVGGGSVNIKTTKTCVIAEALYLGLDDLKQSNRNGF